MEKEMEKIQSHRPASSCDLHELTASGRRLSALVSQHFFDKGGFTQHAFLAFLFFLTTASAL